MNRGIVLGVVQIECDSRIVIEDTKGKEWYVGVRGFFPADLGDYVRWDAAILLWLPGGKDDFIRFMRKDVPQRCFDG